VINIPTKYINLETGWGLLAVTLALSGAAVIPRWNPLIEYCVPHTNCRIVKDVSPDLFMWHQEQASINAAKLRQRAIALAKQREAIRRHRQAKNHNKIWDFDLDKTESNVESTADDLSTNFGELAVNLQHTFSPKSDKEFLRLTAEARRQGWKLEAVQELPGYADWRKVAGGLSLIAAAATAWAVGQIEILQHKRDRREEIDEEFALQQHRKALEGEHSVITAEIDWMSATEQKALEAEYLGEDYEAFIEEQVRGVDENINRQEGALNQLAGTQTLDSINNPSDKVTGQQQTVISGNATKPEMGPEQPSEQLAMTVLNGLVGSRRSTLLVGGTGAGKSVTQAYLLTKFFERYPDAEVWAISQKNDSFCGLDKKKRVVLFDAIDPSAALKVLDHVYSIYDKRRRLPEHNRGNLSPVRLILADWLSINRALEENKNEPVVKESKYLTKLPDIIFNGRELNVCLLVDLQSFNLAAIGLKADRNSRKNFNLVGLGNYSVDEFGSINESYGVLANMIGDQNMVPDENERATLLTEFKRLKPISRANSRPIIFTTLEPARVALLPDLRKYKPGHHPTIKLDTVSPEYLNNLLKLEFDVDQKDVERTPQQKSELSPVAQIILEVIKSANKHPISFDAIRKSRRWQRQPDKQLLIDGLSELIAEEVIEGNEEDGYTPIV